jgi:hypothetical protein
MSKKLGRNDPCWCGSGKKYKYCHLRREREEPVTHQEIAEKQRKVWGKKYCLHPEANSCKGRIVRAHTIQRSGGLTRIAQDGKVYTFFPADHSMLVLTSGKLEEKLVGVSRASTFTGFCGHHDNVTFAALEKEPFRFTTEQIFLLSYRALCREKFAKQAQASMIPFLRIQDRGKGFVDQKAIQDFTSLVERGVTAGLKDIRYCKDRYDNALISKDFSDMQYYVIRLKDGPEIMCSGAVLFEVDFNGNRLQSLYQMNTRLDCLTFSLIGTDDGGAITFSWLGDSAAGTKFVQSLDALSNEEIPHAIVRLTFEFFENTYFAPDWWDGLTDEERENIRTRSSLAANPDVPRRPDCLKDDGMRLVDWDVIERSTNLVL